MPDASCLLLRRVLPMVLLANLTACGREAKEPAPAPSGSASTAAPAITPAGHGAAAAGITIPGLTMGAPIPAGSPWTRDKAQISDECLTYTSPAMPRAYAIVVGGKVERVSFAPGAPFRLPGGIAPGATEAAVRTAYPDLVSEPHKYQDAPAKYLTSPALEPGETGLRFEIGSDGTVEQIHIGLPSSLGLVEGCA